MRVLITGGAGYLGSMLACTILKRTEAEVDVVDTFRHGVASLTTAMMQERLRVRVHRSDYMERMVPLIERADVIYPLAALVGAPLCEENFDEAWQTNYSAIATMLEHVLPGQRVIYPNTNSGYGRSSSANPVTERDGLAPISVYGKSKVAVEQEMQHVASSSAGHEFVALRFATLFGPSYRMRTDLMVNHISYHAATRLPFKLYEGDARRNFLHVADAANVLYNIGFNTSSSKLHHYIEKYGQQGVLVMNCGDDRANMTKRDLCKLVARIAKNKGLGELAWEEVEGVADPDQRDYVVSNALITELFDWQPGRSIIPGIHELLRLFQQPFDAPCYRNY